MPASIRLFSSSVSSCFFQPKAPSSPSRAPSSPFGGVANLTDLAKVLTSGEYDFDQWMAWKNEIKVLIATHSENLEQLDAFFVSITEWGMERNPQKMLAVLIEIVSLDILTQAVTFKQRNSSQPFTNIFDIAAKNANDCPKLVDASLKTQLSLEWKRSRPFILYFIPNMINLFLGAFNFIDSQKKYTTLWDKHLLVEIAWKFCIIPNLLVKALQPVFGVTARVYVIAAVIIAGIGILINCYRRWFKPLPDEIVNCTNLDKQMESGVLDPKVGQIKEVGQLIAALEVDDNVILIGRSGEGKTALIHHFIQLQKDQKSKLSKKLRSLHVYEVDCGLMISNVSYGHADLINHTREPINGSEEQILFFFDEFYQIVCNKDAFRAFKKKFLEDKPRCKCIVAVTPEELKELIKLDADYSLQRRLCDIKVQSPEDKQIQKIIKSMEYCFAPDVPVTKEAIQTIIDISRDKAYLPKIGRAAKAEKIFKTAVGRCRAAYHHHYDVELSKKELKTTREKIWKIKKIIAHQQKIKLDQARLSHLFAGAVTPEDHPEDPDIDMNNLMNVNILDDDLNDKGAQAPRLPSKESFSEKDQIMYLWYSFYAMKSIEQFLNQEVAKINDKIPLQVNEKLVKRVYQDIRSIEEMDVEKDQEQKEEKEK